MAKIPIQIEKIKIQNSTLDAEVKESTNYLLKIVDKQSNWLQTYVCNRDELLKFQATIHEILASTTTAEVLRISEDKAEVVDKHYKEDTLCAGCSYKLTEKCVTCLFVLQSPLERKLFLELNKSYVRYDVQYGINWQGENICMKNRAYDSPTHNFKEVLTVVDFFIEKRNKKLCVYTDGHTYHERTEEQAQHDRTIDRKLQKLGYQVLRYTGKEVNDNPAKIINEIKEWIR